MGNFKNLFEAEKTNSQAIINNTINISNQNLNNFQNSKETLNLININNNNSSTNNLNINNNAVINNNLTHVVNLSNLSNSDHSNNIAVKNKLSGDHNNVNLNSNIPSMNVKIPYLFNNSNTNGNNLLENQNISNSKPQEISLDSQNLFYVNNNNPSTANFIRENLLFQNSFNSNLNLTSNKLLIIPTLPNFNNKFIFNSQSADGQFVPVRSCRYLIKQYDKFDFPADEEEK